MGKPIKKQRAASIGRRAGIVDANGVEPQCSVRSAFMRRTPLRLALGVALFAPATFAMAGPLCSELAAGTALSPGVKSVNSQIIPASIAVENSADTARSGVAT